GAFCWAHFEAIGQVYLSELALAGLLPFLLLLRGRLLRSRTVFLTLALIGLWLGGQIATDIVRETPFYDYARGWANIALFLVVVCSPYLLLHGSRRRFVLFALGLALGQILTPWLAPSPYAEEYPWKFGISQGAALLAVLAPLWRPIRRFPVFALAPLLAISAYSLVTGFRSLFACGLIAALYVVAQRSLPHRPSDSKPKPSFPAIMGLFALSLLAGLATLQIYHYSAREGWMDERSLRVFERQSQGGLGILPGGRTAMFASVPAILDSPIIGHGSKAKNPKLATRALDARRWGYEAIPSSSSYTHLIPSHSMLFGAWVEAGVLGIFFWIWFLLLIAMVLAGLFRHREPLSLLIFYLGASYLWHIPFSPFGGGVRLTTAFTLCLFIVAWQVLRHAAKQRTAPTGAQDHHALDLRIQGSEG
ncbi:MAG: hypothetical protein OXG51_06185, partial [Gammaproteobacteria bacterium]|nr:hypothetical protein [Gammaproteobacteria bacterium]